MVEPRHLKAFAKLCNKSDYGNAVGVEDSMSTILLDLPSITGAFMVSHAIGDIITGDVVEPEVVCLMCLLIVHIRTPLDLSFPNILSIRVNGFYSPDLPPADLKQPAWKPYQYKGRQRILFSVHETIHAALYDRDEIPDSVSISGQMPSRIRRIAPTCPSP
ncbi:hypothetical protein ACFX1S_009356 [Malus domestica]